MFKRNHADNVTVTVDLASKKNESNVSDGQLFNEAVRNLRQAVLSQSKSHRRVATRVRFLIRSIMFGLVSSLLFILFLIYLLTHQVHVLTASLNNISSKTSDLLSSIDDIEHDVLQFETAMGAIPSISTSVSTMNKNVLLLTTNMGSVTQNVTTIQNEMQQLNESLANLSNNTKVLEQSVGRINHDMSTVTKPMKRFNDFNPFN